MTQQWQHFLSQLPARLRETQLRQLDEAFAFSKTGNSEVLFAWLRIAIRHHYTPALPALEHFLTSQGRRKFLQPLYQDLMASDWGRAEAVRGRAELRFVIGLEDEAHHFLQQLVRPDRDAERSLRATRSSTISPR